MGGTFMTSFVQRLNSLGIMSMLVEVRRPRPSGKEKKPKQNPPNLKYSRFTCFVL